jgi:hypothetical protein
MRYLLAVLLLATLVAAGCKHSGWVWNKGMQPEQTVAQHTDEPDEQQADEPDEKPDPDEGQDARHVIYVLGVDGMD